MKKLKRKKPIPKICRTCQLYDGPSQTCTVRALVEGKVISNIPMDPDDSCIWIECGMEDAIKQTIFKVVDPVTGEPTKGNGKVLIEYDEGFFGKN